MNELRSFCYNSKEIRTVLLGGEPWWVLKDVCEVLDIKNATDVAKRLEKDEVTRFNLGSLSGETNIVSENGLYNVILRSRRPEAKPFRKWVTSEVLPSIRKHGAYMTEQTIEQALASPDFLIRLATQLKEEKDKNKALETANSQLRADKQIMLQKAEYFDELVERNLLTSLRETARLLEVKERLFISFLIEKKYLYRRQSGKLAPYEQHKENGLFEMKECFNEKTSWSGTQTLVTPKGRETFRLLVPKATGQTIGREVLPVPSLGGSAKGREKQPEGVIA